jgi:uncharacterized protein (DUF952 family)
MAEKYNRCSWTAVDIQGITILKSSQAHDSNDMSCIRNVSYEMSGTFIHIRLADTIRQSAIVHYRHNTNL